MATKTKIYAFIDESGDENLKSIDPNYPVFVLGSVIMDAEYHDSTAHKLLTSLKAKYCLPGIILHTAEMARCKGSWSFLKDPEVRRKFYSELNDLIGQLDFQLVYCLLDIPAALSKWSPKQRQPYAWLISPLLDAIYKSAGTQSYVEIYVESRQPSQDRIVEAEFNRVMEIGTNRVSSKSLKAKFAQKPSFLGKSANPGAELADLSLSSAGRHYLGKKGILDFEALKTKLPASTGQPEDSIAKQVFP